MFLVSIFWSLVLIIRFGTTSNEPFGENLNSAPENGNGISKNDYYFPEFEAIGSFLQPLLQGVGNRKCRKQLETYIQSLKNSSLWAVQMFDSSAKLPQGVFTSDAYDLGNFDGCVEINLKKNKGDNIFGKYCLVSLTIAKNEELQSHCDNDPDKVCHELDMSVWEISLEQVLKYGLINNVIRTGVCVPNECTARDVKDIYNNLYNNIYRICGKLVEVSVNDINCSTKEASESTVASIVNRTITSLLLWMATSTILDLLGWCDTPFFAQVGIIRVFSAYRNLKSLTSSSGPEHITIIDSLRVCAIILLVLIRRLSFLINGPILNREDVEQVFRQVPKSILVHLCNNVIINTLLVLYGFSHCYEVYWRFRRDSKLSFLRIISAKYLKTIPLYGIFLLFYGYVFETLGDGPIWREKTDHLVENCKRNWLLHILHLNNFLNDDDTCIFKSWYFAVTAHCFVTVPIVVRLAMKSSTTGLTVFGLLTAITFLYTILMNYFHLKPLHILSTTNGLIQSEISTGATDHALPYFLGVASCIMYIGITEGKWKISKAQADIFSTLSAIFCISTVLSPFLFEVQVKTVQATLLYTSSHFLWSLWIGWTIIGILSRKLRILERILKHKCLCSFSKLAYPYLLFLGFIQLYTTSTIRTLDYFTIPRLVWMGACDLLTTWIFALVLYILIQKPVENIVNEMILRVTNN